MSDVKRITITPEQASVWLSKYRADIQRPIRQAWVAQLAAAMKEGEFEQNSTIQLRVLNGETHLIDGRNRLNALVRAGVPQSFFVITDSVNSREDLLSAFRKINEGKRVTNSDFFAAMSLDTETGLARRRMNRLAGAVPFIESGFSASDGSRQVELDKRIGLIRKYAESADLYFDCVASSATAIKNQMHWAVVIAVGVVTFRESLNVYGTQKVSSFWTNIASMINTGPTDPCGVAVKYLSSTKPLTNGRVSSDMQMRIPAYTARYLASCFNAYVAGRAIGRAKPDIDKPIIITGSSFKGIDVHD